MALRLLGIVHAFNEADIVARPLRMLLDSGHETHLFDHGSTDRTAEIAQSLEPHGLAYHLMDRREVRSKDSKNRQVPDVWRHIAAFILGRAGDFDWVSWMDADELLRDRDWGLVSEPALRREVEAGFQVIMPLTRNFWITERDDATEQDPLKRLRWFRLNDVSHPPRGWVPQLTPAKIPLARHIQDPRIRPLFHRHYGWWPAGTSVLNKAWRLDHYAVRSVEQGRRKIMRERTWITPRGGRRYAGHVKTKCRALVLRRAQLKNWTREARELEMPPC